MMWAALFAGVCLALWWIARKPSKGGITTPWSYIAADAARRNRGKLLSENEQQSLAGEVRDLAMAGYDRLFSASIAAGKSERFANEAGVLDAIFCVSANADNLRNDEQIRHHIHRETIPFNSLRSNLGRETVTEYLVWKYFPDQAIMPPMMQAIEIFVDSVNNIDDSETDRVAFVHEAVYSNKYAWQEIVIASGGLLEKKNA